MNGPRLVRIWDRLVASLWLVPLLCTAGGIVLALVTLRIDKSGGNTLVSQSITGAASAVQQLLSTAASSLLSLTSVVLSLTLVAVQLAMGQFSPRIVGSLLADRRSQFSIGLFLGTFAYSMVVLRVVDDGGPGGGTVPGVSVLISYVLIAASIAVLVLYVHHAGQAIRVSGLIDLVGDSTRVEINRLYPERGDLPSPAADDVILAPDAGNIVKLHRRALVRAARDADVVLELVPPLGEFAVTGSVLFRIREGSLDADGRKAVLECVVIGPERTHRGEPSYGLRKLVDIAERTVASSPFDDPTTTVQALHRIHDLVRMLAVREFPTGRHCDAEGKLRFVEPVFDWEGYVRLAFDEVRMAGAGSPQVARALRAALDDLKAVAPADRQGPIERQLELLDEAVKSDFDADADADAARRRDPLGLGSGDDLLARG